MTEEPLVIVDAFAGTGSATAAFMERGHKVLHIETEPDRMRTPSPILQWDVWAVASDPDHFLRGEYAAWRHPDFVWMSPPCGKYAMGGDRDSWVHEPAPFFGPRQPRTRAAWDAVGNVMAAKQLVQALQPRIGWIMENPRAGLRTMGFVQDLPKPFTVSYCQYGDTRMKATDLWSNLSLRDHLFPACHNGDSCHEAAPRGAKTGTQGIPNARERGMVPLDLSEAVCDIVEAYRHQVAPRPRQAVLA